MFEFKRKNKTPTLLQMEATECGAAALGIILGYFGCYVPLSELRLACGVSRDGSNALNMVKVARRYGLNAQGVKADIDELSEVKLPCIAFWEFNHFIVIEEITPQKVYINDPATGPRTISPAEFDRGFTGVILEFAPSAEFKRQGKKQYLLASLMPQLQRIKNALVFVSLLSLLLVVPGILIPGLIKIFIDNILIQQVNGWLLPLLWGFLVVGLLQLILSYLQQYYLLRLNLKLSLTNSAQFFWHILRLPLSFFSQRLVGDIQSRLAANDRIAQWLSGDLSTSLVSLISMFVFALVMFLYDPILASISIVTAIANAMLLFYISERMQNANYQLQQELGKLTGIEMIGVQLIETIKANGEENNFFQHWAGYHAKTLITQQRIHLYNRFLLIFPPLLTGLAVVAILGIGGLRIIHGFLTIGSLVAFQSLFMSFNQPLLKLIGVSSALQQLRGDIMRLEDVNKQPEDERFTKMETTDAKLDLNRSHLVLENVSFGYSPLEQPLIKDINLVLEPGRRVAIVGSTGSGKSTLIKLICGLYAPWSGQITVNNFPLNEINAAKLANFFGYVDQDIFLIEGTIRQNITMWHDSIPDANIEQAVLDAELTTLLAERPEGLETKVAFAGNNFSGGQRQQIDIARALTLNPSVLILDEATSSMDAGTEEKIMNNIRKRQCALLVVAHRLSTIRDCDEILVMENGSIIERGSHAQLFKLQGRYYQLVSSGGENLHE